MLYLSNLANEIGDLLVVWGPIIVLIILLIVVVMYLLAYITRFFHFLKMKEFVYLDDATLELVKKVIQTIIIGLTAIGVIFLAQINSLDVRNVFIVIMKHIPSIFFVVLVIFIAVIFVKLIHRFAEYLRGNLKAKPKKVAPPGTLEYAETALKYTIYVVAAMIALIGGLALLPPEEFSGLDVWFQNIQRSLDPAVIIPLVTSIVLLIFITFVISRIMDTFYEDLYKHSKKYSVRVNDMLKRISKDVLYLVVLLIGVFIILSRFLSYTEMLLTLGIVILIFVLMAFLASDIIKNSFSGLTLMVSDPFSEGNRVKILNGMVCDVQRMDLTHTQVKTLKGEIVNVPNTELNKHEIVNLSRSENFAFSLLIGADSKIPHQKIEELLAKAVEKTSGVINEPKPELFGFEVRDQSIIYELLAYTNSPKDVRKTKSELIYNLQEAFQEEGLPLSMPSS